MKTTYFKGVDWVIITLYGSLVLIGWLMLYSAGHDPSQQVFSFNPLIRQHSIWVVVSLIVFVVIQTIDWKLWYTLALPIYGFCIFLLVAVLIFGVEIKGARSWFSLFGFSFQPAELAKLGTCLALASFLSFYDSDIREKRTLTLSFGLLLMPILLIALQPDAGSALVFLSFLLLFFIRGLSSILYLGVAILIAILILSLVYSPKSVVLTSLLVTTMALFKNFPKPWLAMSLGVLWSAGSIYFYNYGLSSPVIYINVSLVAALIIYNLLQRNQRIAVIFGVFTVLSTIMSFGARFAFDHILKPHQQDRINVWLRPDKCDPRGSLYNVLQSRNAIESGGLQGAGFLEGYMTNLNYVPAQTTDFIFSLVGEEQGFIGIVSVIVMFFILLSRMIIIARRAKNDFISNYSYAVAGIFFVHIFVNIGMSMGLMPVIGIPLPFLSKGGSSLLVFSMMIGILARMDLARHYR